MMFLGWLFHLLAFIGVSNQATIQVDGNREFAIDDDACFRKGSCKEVLDYSSANTREECWRECRKHDGCNFFTFFASAQRCFFFNTCDDLVTDCEDCQLGHISCVPKKDYLIVIAGGEEAFQASIFTPDDSLDCYAPSNLDHSRGYGPNSAFVNNTVNVCGGAHIVEDCAQFRKEDNSWQNSLSLSTPLRYFSSVVSLDETLWILLGGASRNGYFDRLHVWREGQDSFQLVDSSCPEKLSNSCAVRVNRSHSMIIGGFYEGGSNAVYWFDEKSMTFSPAPDYPMEVYSHSCIFVSLGSQGEDFQLIPHTFHNMLPEQVWSVGGDGPEGVTQQAYVYSSNLDDWVEGPQFPLELLGAGSAQYQRTGFLFGGHISHSQNNVFLLDVAEGFQWANEGETNQPVAYSALALVNPEALQCKFI